MIWGQIASIVAVVISSIALLSTIIALLSTILVRPRRPQSPTDGERALARIADMREHIAYLEQRVSEAESKIAELSAKAMAQESAAAPTSERTIVGSPLRPPQRRGLFGLFGTGVSQSRTVPPPADRVTLSAYAPQATPPERTFLVQAFLHLAAQREAVYRLAREADRAATKRGAASASVLAALGDEVRILVECPGFDTDQEYETLTWQGDPISASFELRPHAQTHGAHYIRLAVEIGGVPAGRLRFRVDVDADIAAIAEEAALREGYEPYQFAFLSYSREDRPFVESQARLLRSANIPFFMDVESLRAGDDWEQTLREKVAKSDLFLLYWSQSAAASKWVAQEALWAKELQSRSPEARPDFKTYQIGEAPPFPEELSRHHFERIETVQP